MRRGGGGGENVICSDALFYILPPGRSLKSPGADIVFAYTSPKFSPARDRIFISRRPTPTAQPTRSRCKNVSITRRHATENRNKRGLTTRHCHDAAESRNNIEITQKCSTALLRALRPQSSRLSASPPCCRIRFGGLGVVTILFRRRLR